MVKGLEKLRAVFDLTAEEPIIEDFACALLRDVPLHGRLYLTHDHLLFHAQIFRLQAVEKIPFRDVVSVEKANTALVIPNAIAVTFRTHAETAGGDGGKEQRSNSDGGRSRSASSAVTDDGAPVRKIILCSFAFRDAAFKFVTLLWRVATDLPIQWPAGAAADNNNNNNSNNNSNSNSNQNGNGRKTIDSAGGNPASIEGATAPMDCADTAEIAEAATTPHKAEVSDAKMQQIAKVVGIIDTSPDEHPGETEHGSGNNNGKGINANPMDAMDGSDTTDAKKSNETPPSVPTDGKTEQQQQEEQEECKENRVGGRSRGKLSELDDPPPLPADLISRMKEAFQGTFPIATADFFAEFLDDASDWDDVFHAEKGDTELVVSAWRPSGSPAADGALLEPPIVRDLMYRTALGSRIGPKTTRVHEQQVVRERSPQRVVLEMSVWTPDVPYGDSFSVVSRYIITPAADDAARSQMQVLIGCNFSRSVWVKGFIEKNAFSGGCDFLKLWSTVAMRRLKNTGTGKSGGGKTAGSLPGGSKGAAGESPGSDGGPLPTPSITSSPIGAKNHATGKGSGVDATTGASSPGNGGSQSDSHGTLIRGLADRLSRLASTPTGAAFLSAACVLIVAVVAFYALGLGNGGDLVSSFNNPGNGGGVWHGGPGGFDGPGGAGSAPIEELRKEAGMIEAYIKSTEAALERARERQAVIQAQLAEMIAETTKTASQ